jgi:hypothetical protein
MRRVDDTPLDPRVAASLDAIDRTLAGDPIDPDAVELAELTVLLAGERPRTPAGFANALDARVQRRFAPGAPQTERRRHRGRWWLWTPATGLAAALLAAIVIVLGGSGGGVGSSIGGASSSNSTSFGASRAHGSSAHGSAASSASRSASVPFHPSAPAAQPRRSAAQSTAASPAQPTAAASSQAPVLQPPPNGRKIIQGAQLALTAASSRIDDVAQEVFVVVGQAHGIVSSSTVTATGGPNGYAQFQLRIPSASLGQTMAALSSLRYARVASRTDTTQDVNDQYQADVRRLADARALRTSLLKQLANATTQAEIDSLTAQIHDADAAISSDETTLQSLNNQINYNQVTVTINGGLTPIPVQTGGGGFGFGRAAHDAGRVLSVAAGLALIGLAALVPFALLGALGWWVGLAVRRRRRRQALDLV